MTFAPEVRRSPVWYVVLATLEDVRYSRGPHDVQLRGVFRVQVIGNGVGRIVCWKRRDVCLDLQKQSKEAVSYYHGVEGDLDEHGGE